MCVTCTVTEPATEARPLPSVKAMPAIVRREYERTGAPLCRKCHHGRSGADGGLLQRRLCYSCDARVIERIICRLIERKGHRKALRALRKLAKS
jgi:hypothetical protein